MALSPILQQLKDNEASYIPSDEVKQILSNKVLIALIGPTGVGKSHIINEITASKVHQDGGRFSMAHTCTTRERRDNDPPHYQTLNEGFTIPYAVELISKRAMANYAIHPSGNIYGTLPESYPTKYNLLPLLPDGLPAAYNIGFGTVHPVYLVASIAAYSEQLKEREGDPAFSARISEGISSLEWALQHAEEVSFIENIHGNPSATADAIVALIDRPAQHKDEKEHGIALAQTMLEYIKNYSKG